MNDDIVFADDIIFPLNRTAETVEVSDLDNLLKKCKELSIDPRRVVVKHRNFSKFNEQYPFIFIYDTELLNQAKALSDIDNSHFPNNFFGAFFGNLTSGNKINLMEKMFEHDLLKYSIWTAYNFEIVEQRNFSIDFLTFLKTNTPRIFVNDRLLNLRFEKIEEFSYAKETRYIYDNNGYDKFIFQDCAINLLVDTCASNENSRFTTLKVFKPIKYKKPFITTFGKDSLKYLKSLGFKTFCQYWDEDYDNYSPNRNQFDFIIKTLLDIIQRKTITDIVAETNYICEYNYNLLHDKDWNAWVKDELKIQYDKKQL